MELLSRSHPVIHTSAQEFPHTGLVTKIMGQNLFWPIILDSKLVSQTCML